MQYIPEDNDDVDYDESNDKDQMRICQYYFVPCFFLFDRSGRLLSLVLNLMGSLIAHQCNEPVFDRANRISAITSILIFMRGDVKLRRALSSCKAEMTYVLQNLLSLQVSPKLGMIIHRSLQHYIFAFDVYNNGNLLNVTERVVICKRSHRMNLT